MYPIPSRRRRCLVSLAADDHRPGRAVIRTELQHLLEKLNRLRPALLAITRERLDGQLHQVLDGLLRFSLEAQQFINQHGPGLALDRDIVQRAGDYGRLDLLIDALADQDFRAVILVEALQPAGQVDGVAHDRVVEPGRAADVAHHYLAHVNADAGEQGRFALR